MPDETSPEQQDQTKPPQQPVGEEQQGDLEPQQEEKDSDYIKLSRKELHQELARLEREDQEFRQALGTVAGRHAKRELQGRISELEQENLFLQQAIRRSEVESMPEEEVQKKLRTDPKFAKDYHELVNSDEAYLQNLNMIRMNKAFGELFNRFEDRGLSKEERDRVGKDMQSGVYDNHPDWIDAYPSVESALWEALEKQKTPNGASSSNTNLSRISPDLSSQGSRPASRIPTMEEYTAMSKEEADKLPSSVKDEIMAAHITKRAR